MGAAKADGLLPARGFGRRRKLRLPAVGRPGCFSPIDVGRSGNLGGAVPSVMNRGHASPFRPTSGLGEPQNYYSLRTAFKA